MDNFLRVFEAKALAAALTDAGHSVSERTVQRWKSGTTKPKPQDIRAIHRVIRLAGTEKAPPPEWAAAMEQRLGELILTNRETVIQALAEETARYGVERALAAQPPAEPAPDKQGPQRERAVRR